MVPQWVDSPVVGPDTVARGVPRTSAGGGQEIHYDSSMQRAEFANGGGQPLDVTDPAYVPQIVAPSAGALAETLPPDVLDAMAKGNPLTPEQIQALSRRAPVQHAPIAIPQMAIPIQHNSAMLELVIPVGNGITARVSFTTAQPAQVHWRKLIRHLEIEADPIYEEDRNEREAQRIAAEKHLAGIRAELAREANSGDGNIQAGNDAGESELPRPVRRRKRKNDGASPEPG